MLAGAVRAMIWSKHAPSFEKLFPQARQQRELSDEDILKKVRALNALFGGKEA